MSDRELMGLLEIRATPQIEQALAEQIRTLPMEMVRRSAEASSTCFGLVVCCVSA